MPNGIDKNWYRVCGAIDGFRVRYGNWPTNIHLPEGAIEYLFTKETFAKIEEKLVFVYDDSTYIAEGSPDKSYNLGEDGFPEQLPDISACDWLNVTPDSKMVEEYYTPLGSVKDSKKAERRKLFSSALLSDIALASVMIVLLSIAAKESGIMGFILFTATAIAFSIATMISIVVGAVGIVLYVWRGRSSQRTRRVFWYFLFGVVLIGIIIINSIPFPQAPAGSNYTELANEWVVKAIVYALIPGVGCLLGGITSLFARTREEGLKTDGR